MSYVDHVVPCHALVFGTRLAVVVFMILVHWIRIHIDAK